MHIDSADLGRDGNNMRLIAEKLCGSRGGEVVFGPVGFGVDAGRALVVTGANGSGKSTLLKVLAGLLPATSGTVRIDGADRDATMQSCCHYLGHENAMKTALTVTENLEFWQRFLGDANLAVEDALSRVGLATIGHLPFGYLSTGQRRRAAIARLLVSRRPIWLLDEPTAGLDSHSEVQLAGIMHDHLRDGGVLLAATHLPLGLEGAAELRLGELG